MKCVMCKQILESALGFNDWEHLQPVDGGEINLIFSYGSNKFDNCMGITTFRGLICDDCAEMIMKDGDFTEERSE